VTTELPKARRTQQTPRRQPKAKEPPRQKSNAEAKRRRQTKQPEPQAAASAELDDLQPLSMEAKKTLQDRLDKLDDDGMDRVLEFLELDMRYDGGTDEEVQLDLDRLAPARQHALVQMVSDHLSAISQAGSRDQPTLFPGV
jgi:hypothetical protein